MEAATEQPQPAPLEAQEQKLISGAEAEPMPLKQG